MSEFKGTPGPWFACKDGACSCKDIGGHDHPVAKVYAGEWGDEPGNPYGEISEPVAIANARLIAAAPELLEALKVAVEWMVDLANSGDAGFWDPEKTPQVIQGRAAIAKALGEGQ